MIFHYKLIKNKVIMIILSHFKLIKIENMKILIYLYNSHHIKVWFPLNDHVQQKYKTKFYHQKKKNK